MAQAAKAIRAGLVMLGLLAGVLVLGGCSPDPMPPPPPPEQPLLVKPYPGQVPEPVLTHLQQKYPHDYWRIRPGSMRLAVGPFFVQKEALTTLSTMRPVVKGRGPFARRTMAQGEIHSLYLNRFSLEARARAIDRLSGQAWAEIVVLDENLLGRLATGSMPLEELRDQGVDYLLEGTVSNEGSPQGSRVAVYLRVIDTGKASVAQAASGMGKDLITATDQALDQLIKGRQRPNQAPPQTYGRRQP